MTSKYERTSCLVSACRSVGSALARAGALPVPLSQNVCLWR